MIRDRWEKRNNDRSNTIINERLRSPEQKRRTKKLERLLRAIMTTDKLLPLPIALWRMSLWPHRQMLLSSTDGTKRTQPSLHTPLPSTGPQQSAITFLILLIFCGPPPPLLWNTSQINQPDLLPVARGNRWSINPQQRSNTDWQDGRREKPSYTRR